MKGINNMLKLEKTVLLITSTIKPNEKVFSLALKDKTEREKQYFDALLFYIAKTKLKNIIYCDNSNTIISNLSYLEKLATKYKKQFEYLSFHGNTSETVRHGKGYGEGEIIKYILNNSKLIKNMDYLIKITGRLYVTNINTLLKLCSNHCNYFDMTKTRRCETRFYMIQKSVYERNFINCYLKVNDKKDIWLEHIFKNIILKQKIVYKMFPILPKVRGISGSTGKRYHDSKIKYYAKIILSKLKLYKIK